MTNELKLMVELEIPIPFKVADATAIPKGSLLELTESMTVVVVTGQKKMIAGVAAEEKIANDGKLSVKVYMRGIFKAVAGAAVAIGVPLMSDATANQVETATGMNGAAAIGYALEAPSGVNQTFLMYFQPGTGGELA